MNEYDIIITFAIFLFEIGVGTILFTTLLIFERRDSKRVLEEILLRRERLAWCDRRLELRGWNQRD
jgi:hypothetical protein